MPEGLDQARQAFANEVAPATRPRDQTGRFVITSKNPETMFSLRPIEGDEKGDTSDGGPDPRFVEHERRIADGRVEEGDERDEGKRRSVSDPAGRRPPAADDGHEGAEAQPRKPDAREPDEPDLDLEDQDQPRPEGTQDRQDGEDAESPKFEVTVDGQPVAVTLSELTRSYVAEKTFNERVGRVAQVAQVADQEMGKAQALRDNVIQRLSEIEAMWTAALPQEPNWDELYRADPKQAHDVQKQFATMNGRINHVRQQRFQLAQEAQADYERRTAEYARNGFAEFVQKARIADQESLNKELASMRRTGANLGFTEQELATCYDPRMLLVLQKASKYDRIMSNRPPAQIAGRGKTLQPGSAPRIGNGTRRSFDDAQSRLARSGRLEDAEAVFDRMLR